MQKSFYFFVYLALLLLSISTTSSAQIVFDGSPGQSPPPSTLGPYTMTPVVDNQPTNNMVRSTTAVSSPISGSIGISPATYNLYPFPVGGAQYSAYFAEGYTGRVYNTQLDVPITLTMPPNTRAFYFYAQADNFGIFNVIATTQDGTTSGPISTTTSDNSAAGKAKYFGFYTQNLATTIVSITIEVPDATDGPTVGQFGIYQEACTSTSATAGAITASSTSVCAANPVRLTAPATGSSFVFTGPNGYVFSNVYRTPGSYTAIAEGVTQPGTYTLTPSYQTGCPSATSTITLTACP